MVCTPLLLCVRAVIVPAARAGKRAPAEPMEGKPRASCVHLASSSFALLIERVYMEAFQTSTREGGHARQVVCEAVTRASLDRPTLSAFF